MAEEIHDNPTFKNLETITKGGNREILTRDKESSVVVKAKPTGRLVTDIFANSDESKAQKAERIKQIILEQRELREIFGEMYIPSRFPNYVVKNDQYYLVTHEPKRSDLYPSKNHENITNLCFLGYFGLTKNNLNEQNLKFIFETLFGKTQGNYNGKEINNLKRILDSSEAKVTLQKYLEAVEKYAKNGLMLDLVGNDNVILNHVDQKYEVIINNSAAKIERIDTFSENLQKINNKSYGPREINDVANQIAVMVNINLLCDLIQKLRVFKFSEEDENLIKNVLTNWQDFYVAKNI